MLVDQMRLSFCRSVFSLKTRKLFLTQPKIAQQIVIMTRAA